MESIADSAKRGRPSKPTQLRAKTRTIATYDQEWAAVKRVARAKNFKTPFDLFRDLLRKMDHPLSRGAIEEPRSKSDR